MPAESVRDDPMDPSTPTPNSRDPRASIPSILAETPLHLVRITVLLSLVYSTWHFGAVTAEALSRLCWIVGFGLVATLCVRGIWSQGTFRLPKPLLVMLTIWILYSCLQFLPQSVITDFWFTRTHQHAAERTEGNHDLLAASQKMGTAANGKVSAAQIASTRFALASGTAIPEATRQATVPYILALALVIMTAVGFQTDRSRKYLLWAIALNATAMAMWGLVQRAGGGTEILPGIPIPFDCVPFGSFIYKNAGAAALLPAVACVLAIALMSLKNVRSANGYSGHRPASGSSQLISQLKTLKTPILILVTVVLGAGLFASLSRGAWLTFALALVATCLLYGVSLRDRRAWIGLAAFGAFLVVIALSTRVTKQIANRAEQVSLSQITADQRWAQWADGFRTAVANLPSGTGLGTYGHATLPFQSEPRGYWFRDAHNQYLEVLTETGLVGITLVLLGMIWFGRLSVRLFRAGGKPKLRSVGTRQAWGTIGMMLLVCGGVHSCIDFVLKIPANMFLYSILIAAVAVTRRHRATSGKSARPRNSSANSVIHSSSRSANHSVGKERDWFSGWLLDRSATWAVLSLLLICVAGQFASRQNAGDFARNESTEDPIDGWTDEQLANQIARMGEAIENQPLRSDLYLRRSSLRLTHYRRNLVAVAKSQGQNTQYSDTRLETVHALLKSVPAANLPAVRQQFLSTEQQKSTIAQVLVDVQQSLLLNPYHPGVHLRCAMLAPLGDYSTQPWLANSAGLSNNNKDALFTNGLLAYCSGDNEIMIDQWSKSLAISHEPLQTVMDLAIQKVPMMRIVQELVPTNRLDRIVDLLRRQRDDWPQHADDVEIAAILDHLGTTDRFDVFRRHSTLASLNEMLGRTDQAIDHWQQAMDLEPRDAKVRLFLAVALRRAERFDDALDQVTLGQRLFPDDERFQRLAGSIRRDIVLRR